MAKRLGISQPTLNRLESASQNTTLRTLTRLCRGLRCDPGTLFAGRVTLRRGLAPISQTPGLWGDRTRYLWSSGAEGTGLDETTRLVERANYGRLGEYQDGGPPRD